MFRSAVYCSAPSPLLRRRCFPLPSFTDLCCSSSSSSTNSTHRPLSHAKNLFCSEQVLNTRELDAASVVVVVAEMYIKQVIIEGEKVATEPFSPKVNCVVGANGSGKTNFFNAIRFVLGDLFQNLRSVDRHALLHEDAAGHQVLSAFVEIVFDNSYNGIPVDKEEVCLRRTVGLKKDRYFLDGKHITKTKVMNLLECAGLSRSNPYYVVQQGKIASLTLMKDAEFLDLLKEVGGTRVYLDMLQESLKIMKETGNKRKQIIQDVQYLDERLRELDEEKEELRKYQQLDKQRRSLEYTIYDKELHDARQKLGEVSMLYRATQFSNKSARDKWLQKEIDDLQRILSSNLEQAKQLQDEIQDLNTGLQNQDTYIEELKTEIKMMESNIRVYLKRRRDELQDRRKSLWEKESVVSAEIDEHKRVVAEAHKSLDLATPVDIRRGLNSVRKLVKDHKIGGVYGPIIELFGCEEKYFACVEITAGNSLFHVVVDTDETSTRLSRYLDSLNGGQVTFIPVNEVRTPHVTYPHSSDVVPLLKILKFATPHAAIFQQVFGRTVICMDSDVATKVARSQGLDLITLEGDQVSKEGSMTRGFYEYEHSKLKFANVIQQNTWAINEKEMELKRLRKDLQDIDTGITKLVTEQQKVDAKQAHDKSELEQLRQDIANAAKQKQSISKALEKKEKLLANSRYQIEQLNSTMIAKRKIVGTYLIDHLSPEEKDLSRLSPEITQLKEMLIDCKTGSIEALEDECQRTLQDKEKEPDQLLSKKNILLAEQEFYMKKIRDLGSLPSDAFDMYKRKSIRQLHKMLHKCNEQLQQFSHVNKKTLDQYVNFTEQREELQKRQAKLDASYEQIREKISFLDQRKDESIERTFKVVARHFQEAFSELVPGGHGFLAMTKKKDVDHGDDDLDDDEPHGVDPEGRVEKYIGVKVKVSFTGQGETQSMKQLSVAQKTVVALTLIFAIQRWDPAPFYLFDEIDAAIDPQYRIGVGNMIRRLADMANTQFITTTFRPELLEVADKIYGVTHKNRVSCLNVISKDRALDLFEHDQSHNI